jgi:predicted phosphate transport protein (TIGR00153 family)
MRQSRTIWAADQWAGGAVKEQDEEKEKVLSAKIWYNRCALFAPDGDGMARFRLIPLEEKFYTEFIKMSDEVEKAARLFGEMIAADPPNLDKADELKEIEHTCDALIHGILQRLHRTFVTPIDREDIHALARTLDDVVDMIDAAAGFVRLYRVERVRYGARELSHIITRMTQQLQLAMGVLEKRKGLSDYVVEINRLENEADRLHQRAMQRLFDEERDPIEIIKWKEIIDYLEQTTDRCEDVADLLEGIVLKHG